MKAPRPAIVRQAAIPAGLVFRYGGRFLKVVKSYGTDKAAPVIVEEMEDRHALAGQLSLWGAEGVARATRRKVF